MSFYSDNQYNPQPVYYEDLNKKEKEKKFSWKRVLGFFFKLNLTLFSFFILWFWWGTVPHPKILLRKKTNSNQILNLNLKSSFIKKSGKKKTRFKFKFMANNIIVSGAGTASANGTYTPNTANLASPARNIPLFAMAGGANFYLYDYSAGTSGAGACAWAVGPDSTNANRWYGTSTYYSSFAAALTAGPQASTYTVVAGTAPVPTVISQAAGPTGNESGPSNVSNATPQVPLPGAPTSLTAAFALAMVTGNPIAPTANLAWVAPSGGQAATSYNVHRGTTVGGENTTPLATGITGLTYTDTTPLNATTYFYVVDAVDAAGEGIASNEVGIKTATLPPTTLAVTGSNGSASLLWTGATGAINYNVKRSLSAGGTFTTIATVATTTYTDTSVTNGTTYYYEVTALD